MLLNSLYTVAHYDHSSQTMTAVISIDPKHKIFGGHFPGKPVLPGVCMVQMVKEIFEAGKGAKYLLAEAGNIKFLSVLEPAEHTTVEVLIKYNEIRSGEVKVEGSLFSGSVTFFKLMGILKPA